MVVRRMGTVRSTAAMTPLARLVHNDRPGYRQAGYGGRPIAEWPFYSFIRLYLDGHQQRSLHDWTDWLVAQFGRFGGMPKYDGGMYQGSVHQLAARQAGAGTERALAEPSLLSPDEVMAGARTLVERRLATVASIATVGYRSELGGRVFGVTRAGRVVLQGGHHRAATLYALGHEKMPVVVYPGVIWEVRKWLVIARKTFASKQN